MADPRVSCRRQDYIRISASIPVCLTLALFVALSSGPLMLHASHVFWGACLALVAMALLVSLGSGMRLSRTEAKILAPFLFFLLYVGALLSAGYSRRAMITATQLLSIFGILVLSLRSKWNGDALKGIGALATVLPALAAYDTWVFGLHGNKSKHLFFFGNENLSAGVLFCGLFFVAAAFRFAHSIRAKAFWSVAVAGFLASIYFTNCRSILLALFATSAVYGGWGLLTRNKTVFVSFWVALLVILISMPFLYLGITELDSAHELNSAIAGLSSKPLFSGRQQLWQKVLLALEGRFIFGVGPQYTFAEVFETTYSAHNGFLQLALQLGVAGLGVFVVFLFCLWLGFWKRRERPLARLGSAFFIGILIHECLEVTLLQNNLALGLIKWLALTAALTADWGPGQDELGFSRAL